MHGYEDNIIQPAQDNALHNNEAMSSQFLGTPAQSVKHIAAQRPGNQHDIKHCF